jgi:IS30 family transposase
VGAATGLGRSPSTISRELRRNALDTGRYSAQTADGAYLLRRQRNAVLERDERLARFVRDRLAEGWSPEQISGWLKSGAEPGLCALAMETIYAFIYRARQKAEELWRYLTRRRRTRRPLRTRAPRDTIPDHVSIHERPPNVADRSEVGHWEGNLIICQRTRPVLVLHERKTRVTLAARLTGKSAAETASVIMAIFRRLDPRLRQSITPDRVRGRLFEMTPPSLATPCCARHWIWRHGSATPTPLGKRAASGTPMADCAGGCRGRPTSTTSPTKTSRRSS